MPEGPEVKYLVDTLNKKILNNSLKKIKILGGRYKKHKPPININKLKFPLKIISIKCKGKFIYFEFDKDEFIMFVTLGMSGWFIDENEKHSNIEFVFSKKSIFFNDYRNFGTIKFCTQNNLIKKLNCLGPDILDVTDNFNIFNDRLERKRNDTTIGRAIMDQKVACGCGNYLRSECLYIAKINPFTKISTIKLKDRKLLWNILKQLAWVYYDEKKGVKLGIINNKYKLYNLYKKKGPTKYKRDFGYFLVYRNDVDPFGNTVIREKINGRMVHYVKKIQKLK